MPPSRDMYFTDRSVVAGTRRRDSDGALLADVRIARTGVQYYTGREVDPNNEHGFRDARVVRIYRPGEEVFSQDTMASAAHRPVTNEHPAARGDTKPMVDAENWRRHAVGNTADEVSAEGIFIRVPLIVSDAATIADIENGKREVSAGYTSVLDWTSGETADGQEYDAVQRNIRINHVAVVGRGRAGSSVRIGDSDAPWGSAPMSDGDEGADTMNDKLKTVTVDGITIDVTDQGAQVISKLQGEITRLTDAATETASKHQAALDARDAEIAKRDGEIEELRKKIVDGAALDKMVAARAALVDSARAIAKDAKFDGLDEDGIRRAAVAAVIGDEAIKDKSQAYVDARFEILVEDSKKGVDTFRAASMGVGATTVDNADARAKAYADMVADLKRRPDQKAN